MKKKLYKTLGVNEKASQAEIKTAYREGSKKHHPDKGGDAETFSLLAKAHEVLSDPIKRKRYDETGIENEPTSLEAKARTSLVGLFNSALVEYGFEKIVSMDIFGQMDIVIDNKLHEMKTRKEKIKTMETDYKKIIKKIKHKKKKEVDLFTALLNQKIDYGKIEIAKIKEEEKVGKEAKKILENYSFDFDEAIVRATSTGMGTYTVNINSWTRA